MVEVINPGKMTRLLSWMFNWKDVPESVSGMIRGFWLNDFEVGKTISSKTSRTELIRLICFMFCDKSMFMAS
jgi:hypothetical protein